MKKRYEKQDLTWFQFIINLIGLILVATLIGWFIGIAIPYLLSKI